MLGAFTPFGADHPLDLPVAAMAARVRDKDDALTAVELVQTALLRIELLDPGLNAFLCVTGELGLAQAAAVDAKVQAGEDPGPLAGVPLAVKDNLAVPGAPMTCASKILEGYSPPTWATSVERAIGAGACVVGKTNLDEFAMGSSTENSAFGPSRNPYDPARVPGGSSGGSAAAVAAGMAPLALGSDTGGSIRQPAALCGIVGLKPTYGRVSRSGLVAFASSLDQVGPMARSAADARALLQAIAGTDPLDATTRPMPALEPDESTRLDGLRYGTVTEFGLDGVPGGEQAQAAVNGVRATLDAAGASSVAISLPLVTSSIPVYYIVAPAEASSNLARYDGVRYGRRAEDVDSLQALYARTRDEGFGDEVKRRILIGTFALSSGYADAYYKKAMAARTRLREQFDAAFEQCDVLLSATTPTAAFGVGEKADDPLAMYLCDILTVAANLAGIPAISIPCGMTTDGLPLGLQLWGRPGSEGQLLDVAERIAEASGHGYVAPSVKGAE
ncbi:MAG: Asp-tRNA(Asn)/Glu-tRNA(Gln) amidotransferase subunit GatA [Planctomycetota bacterium]|nr:Asp-tRNA(Asn)/Glu-tRNA(Gln) amidotransferase subunit GatA [Planctomycetota bacterium]